MSQIQLTVNGTSHTVQLPEGRYMLLDVLRDRLELTGAKFGCGAGKCGACTVILDGEAVTSCTVPAAKADGKDIITIEGISSKEGLHPIQQAFLDHGAVQCGYCTPGFIMRLYGLLEKKPVPDEQELHAELEKNLCRCTGYESILDAARTVIADNQND